MSYIVIILKRMIEYFNGLRPSTSEVLDTSIDLRRTVREPQTITSMRRSATEEPFDTRSLGLNQVPLLLFRSLRFSLQNPRLGELSNDLVMTLLNTTFGYNCRGSDTEGTFVDDLSFLGNYDYYVSGQLYHCGTKLTCTRSNVSSIQMFPPGHPPFEIRPEHPLWSICKTWHVHNQLQHAVFLYHVSLHRQVQPLCYCMRLLPKQNPIRQLLDVHTRVTLPLGEFAEQEQLVGDTANPLIPHGFRSDYINTFHDPYLHSVLGYFSGYRTEFKNEQSETVLEYQKPYQAFLEVFIGEYYEELTNDADIHIWKQVMTSLDPSFPVLDSKSAWVEMLTGAITMTCLNHSITHNYAAHALVGNEHRVSMRMREPAPNSSDATPTMGPMNWVVDRMQLHMFINAPFVTQRKNDTLATDLTYPVTNTAVRQANRQLVSQILSLNTTYAKRFPIWNFLPSIAN